MPQLSDVMGLKRQRLLPGLSGHPGGFAPSCTAPAGNRARGGGPGQPPPSLLVSTTWLGGGGGEIVAWFHCVKSIWLPPLVTRSGYGLPRAATDAMGPWRAPRFQAGWPGTGGGPPEAPLGVWLGFGVYRGGPVRVLGRVRTA